MKESNYNILSERVHNLEKNIEFVVDWLEEISPDLKKANQREKKLTACKIKTRISQQMGFAWL